MGSQASSERPRGGRCDGPKYPRNVRLLVQPPRTNQRGNARLAVDFFLEVAKESSCKDDTFLFSSLGTPRVAPLLQSPKAIAVIW